MTDAQFLLHVLKDGGWHSRDSILARSMDERGCGLTVHSRAADLRKQGHDIIVDVRGGSRRASFYKLGSTLEAAPADDHAASGRRAPSLARAAGFVGVASSVPNPGPLSIGSVKAGAGALNLFDNVSVDIPGVTGDVSVTDTRYSGPVFACVIDESGGLRG